MTTLDNMIATLQKHRESIGGDAKVFVDGWNDTGVVIPTHTRVILVAKTRFDEDGEITRVWEEDVAGERAVLIA